VNWVGPADINPSEAIKDLQNAVATGADGAIVAAFPGNLFKVPIDHANMPVITVDLESPGSKAVTHLGPNKYALGVALAQQFAKAMPAKASGEFVGGICVPGLAVLVAPQQGFVDTMKKLRPGVTFKINVPVDGDPTKNYGSWQRIIAQNPKALGFFGECDQDVPNLIKLKKDSGGKYLIGATSGDSPANIAAVKSGIMTSIISQNGWPEGYLSAAILLGHIAKKTPLPNGWIDTGFTAITKANADEVTARINNPSLNATEFKSFIQKVLSNPQGAAKPFTDCRGCGITFTP
jgi:ribose transport system substrate-binding protein